MSESEQKFVKTVCPHCDHVTRSPNNFLNTVKFWKYETVEKACPDAMDCIRHLKQRLHSTTNAALLTAANREYKCSHCPHCNGYQTTTTV